MASTGCRGSCRWCVSRRYALSDPVWLRAPWAGWIRFDPACSGLNLTMCGGGVAMVLCGGADQLTPLSTGLRECVRSTWAKALLQLEPAAATPVGAANLLRGIVVFVVCTLLVETPGETPSPGPPIRMMAAQPASLPFLKASSLGSIWLLCGYCLLPECWWWWCGQLGADGGVFLLHVFLFGCLSCGLCPAAMHLQRPVEV